jgi:TPR repeat protein
MIDQRESLKWVIQSVGGDAYSQSHVSQLFRIGRGGVTKNEAKAFYLSLLSAIQGESQGLLKLGTCLNDGIGCAIDEGKAIRALTFNLGSLHHVRSIRADTVDEFEPAFQWLKKATEQSIFAIQ